MSHEELRELFSRAEKETNTGYLAKAINTYKKIIKKSGTDDRAKHLAYWGIGEIYLNGKKYDQAEYHLKSALALSPEESIYHYYLGCTYRYQNRVSEALIHLKKAIEIDGSKDVYWAEYGWVYGFNVDTAEGIKLLKKAISLNPKNYNCLRDICVLYMRNQQYKEALVCIEEAEAMAPDNPDIKRIKDDVSFFHSEFERLTRNGNKNPPVA